MNSAGELLVIKTVGTGLVNITRLCLATASDIQSELERVRQCHHDSQNGLLPMSSCINSIRDLVRANECTLYWCIHQYVASVKAGKFTETYLKSWWDRSSSTSSGIGWYIETTSENWTEMTIETGGKPLNSGDVVNSTSALSAQDTDLQAQPQYFSIEPSSHFNLSNWLGSFFSKILSLDDWLDHVNSRSSRFEDAILFYQSSQTPRTNDSGIEDRISVIVSNIAWSLTQLIRWDSYDFWPDQPAMNWTKISEFASIPGTSFQNINIVEVRLQWLTLPAVLLTLTALMTVSTKIRTLRQGIPAWRSSTIPLMVHGPYSVTQSPHRLHTLDRLDRMARRTKVTLQANAQSWKLRERTSSTKPADFSSALRPIKKTMKDQTKNNKAHQAPSTSLEESNPTISAQGVTTAEGEIVPFGHLPTPASTRMTRSRSV